MSRVQNAIRRLELHAEQLTIHLRAMQRNSPGVDQMRSVLFTILLRLVALKTKRERIEDDFSLDRAA
jgi:hypothetical protein